MAEGDFDRLAEMIETEGHPFPVSQARRLILRATGRTPASKDLAIAIDQLNMTLVSLAGLIEEIGAEDAVFTRHDALFDLCVLRRLCAKPH